MFCKVVAFKVLVLWEIFKLLSLFKRILSLTQEISNNKKGLQKMTFLKSKIKQSFIKNFTNKAFSFWTLEFCMMNKNPFFFKDTIFWDLFINFLNGVLCFLFLKNTLFFGMFGICWYLTSVSTHIVFHIVTYNSFSKLV